MMFPDKKGMGIISFIKKKMNSENFLVLVLKQELTSFVPVVFCISYSICSFWIQDGQTMKFLSKIITVKVSRIL